MLDRLDTHILPALPAPIRRAVRRAVFLIQSREMDVPSSWLSLSNAEREEIATRLIRRANNTKTSLDMRRNQLPPDTVEQTDREIRDQRALAELVMALNDGRIA